MALHEKSSEPDVHAICFMLTVICFCVI